MNISCVLRDIPKDLTLAAKQSGHPPLPHLTILPHRSAEDPNPVPVMPSLDLRLVRVNQDPYLAVIPLEGSKW
jgi:hypothetical protein